MEKVKRKRVYLTQYPHLIAEWHQEKNGDLDPSEITHGIRKKVWWRCVTCGGEWEARVLNRTINGTGCPFCSGRRSIPGETDIVTSHPELVAEWSEQNELDPEEVSAWSHKKVLWNCLAGHAWSAPIYTRSRGDGCPYCSGRRTLPGFNCLVTTHPDLSVEWSERNGFGPESVSAGSSKIVWWVCLLGHTWRSKVANRSLLGRGCPKCCLKHTSKIETELFRLLSEQFPDAEQGVRVGRWSVDVLLPKEMVVVEYDGTYWHQDREQHDTRKTLDLLKLGYRVVRIREQSNQYTLPSLGIDNPRYLELTYTYDPAYTNLSTVIDKISQWLRS